MGKGGEAVGSFTSGSLEVGQFRSAVYASVSANDNVDGASGFLVGDKFMQSSFCWENWIERVSALKNAKAALLTKRFSVGGCEKNH